MKPIHYVISKAWKPNGISNQGDQFAEIFKRYINKHTIRRWHRNFKGKEYFGFTSLALNRMAPLIRQKGEILHCSDFSFAPLIHDAFDIVEIWDMIPFTRLWEHQDRLFKSMYYCSFIPGVLTADTVVTHTKFVQKQINEMIYKDAVVIPGGIDAHKFDIVPDVRKEENSILCVSGHYAHKNMLNLVQACGIASNDIGEIHLRIVGPSNHETVEYMNNIAKYFPGLNIEHLGFVSQERLIEFYNMSYIYCSLSQVEGFGITPVEAMACGTIPLLSDIEVHKEVCGPLAHYIDGLNYDEVADSIGFILNRPYTDQLRGKLRVYALKYDWCSVIPQWTNLYHHFGIEIPYIEHNYRVVPSHHSDCYFCGDK